MCRRWLLAVFVACIAVPAFAKGGGSQPTCQLPPTDVFSVYYPSCEDSLQISWAAPACSGITKYAVEVTVTFVPPSTECGDPAYVQTFSFTSPNSTPSIVIPFSELDTFEFVPEVWCGPASVRVKALTAPSGSSNRSQNNAFSTPSTDFEFDCF